MRQLRKRKFKGATLQRRQAVYGYIFTIPLILGIVFLFLPEMVNTLVYSISDVNMVDNVVTPIGFAHYYNALFEDRDYTWKLGGSIAQLVTDIPVIVIFSLFISTVLNQNFRGRLFARVVFFVPVLLATGIISQIDSMSNLMLGQRVVQTGMTIDSLQLASIEELLASVNLPPAITSVVVGAADGIYRVVQSSGIQIFIFLAGLQEIPESLYEAAKVEGCSGWELFWKITIPMISP